MLNACLSCFIMPLEPAVAPCGWPCPHRCPTVMGPFGDVVIHTAPGQALSGSGDISMQDCLIFKYITVWNEVDDIALS